MLWALWGDEEVNKSTYYYSSLSNGARQQMQGPADLMLSRCHYDVVICFRYWLQPSANILKVLAQFGSSYYFCCSLCFIVKAADVCPFIGININTYCWGILTEVLFHDHEIMLKFTSLNLLHLWLIKNDRWCHLHHFQTDSFWNPAYFSPITAFSVFPLLWHSVKLKWSDGWRQQTSDRWSVTSAEGWNRQLACVFYREIKKTWDGFAQLQCPAGSRTSQSVTVYWKWKLASYFTVVYWITRRPEEATISSCLWLRLQNTICCGFSGLNLWLLNIIWPDALWIHS